MPPPRRVARLPVMLSPDRLSDFEVSIAPPLVREVFPLRPLLVRLLVPPTLLIAPPAPVALLSVKLTVVRLSWPTKFRIAPPRLPTPPVELSRNVDRVAPDGENTEPLTFSIAPPLSAELLSKNVVPLIPTTELLSL